MSLCRDDKMFVNFYLVYGLAAIIHPKKKFTRVAIVFVCRFAVDLATQEREQKKRANFRFR